MNYKRELRENRKLFLQRILEINDEITESDQKGIIRKVTSIQNSTRGKLGELLGEIYLTTEKKAKQDKLQNDSATFETPFGRRRVDIFWKEMKFAVEVKMGYVYNSKTIRNQMKKDHYLKQNGIFDKVIWLLIKGGSKNLKQELLKNNIPKLEGWPLDLNE